VNEFCELVHFLSLSPRREHVMSQMEYVVSLAVVWAQESLYMIPCAFNPADHMVESLEMDSNCQYIGQ
jgi:hypothetical protein